jgi:DNA-binding NarL/FixJ family response regulator
MNAWKSSHLCETADRIGRAAPLSEREHDVLDLLACGADDKYIAAKLKVSHRTVRSHVSALFVKLRVHNRTEVALVGLWAHLRTCEACRGRLEGQRSWEASRA